MIHIIMNDLFNIMYQNQIIINHITINYHNKNLFLKIFIYIYLLIIFNLIIFIHLIKNLISFIYIYINIKYILKF